MSTLKASIELPLEPSAAFDVLIDELASALDDFGMRFETGPKGRVTQDLATLGQVDVWKPGECITFQWHASDWNAGSCTKWREIRSCFLPRTELPTRSGTPA